ncbi:SCO7613 C-terminal domain-containing membrane protein [Rhizomonospora bruguierae]|uniref:SCO7613 C-terminal domain-containing membrane protein n=1 Tax=Rhizomonospora bruguierae TaxID=1581705 RepID=UPI001BCCBAEF|nr:hypothetical protein [Micromonospora sp. NBRC 107566]
MTSYPCPACRAPADLVGGCRRCGWPPDPEAAEVIRLGAVIHDHWARLNEAQRRRDALAAGVRARVAARAAATPVPAPVPAPPVAPVAAVPAEARAAGPETSTRTVQNVLFVLGGALLGIAAIVFTAVAWATYGVGGRAAILATVTVAALAVPPIALHRRLRATAETFAVFGLLLLLLDGYAARYVDLLGIASIPGHRYAGAVLGATALLALAYGAATRLRGPGWVALVLAQPVAPVLLARAGLGYAGWSLVFTLVAAADLALVARGRLARAWLPAAPLLLLAFVFAAGGISSADGTGAAIRAGSALVAFAGALWAAPRIAGRPELHPPVDAVLVLAAAVATARVVAFAAPGYLLILSATLALAIAAAVQRLGVGARFAGWAVLVLAGAVTGMQALVAGATTAYRALPAWHAALGTPEPPFDGQLPAAVAVLALAAGILAPRAARGWLVAGAAALLALALPGGLALPWWAPPALDLTGVALLSLLAVRSARTGTPGRLPAGVVALALAGHAALAGLARPGSTAAVAGALVVLGLVVAAAARPASAPVAGVALAVGMLALPAGAAAGAQVLGLPAARAALAATVVLLFAVRAVRRLWTDLTGYAVPALALAALAVCWPPAPEPAALYPAVGILVLGLAGWSVSTVVAMPVLGGVLAVHTAAAWSAVLVRPFGQLGRVWDGVPAAPTVPATAVVALALACAGWAALGRDRAGSWRGTLPAALLGGPAALLTALAAARVPWPVLPAAALLLGIAALAGAAFDRLPAPPAVPAGALLVPAALAGAAATRETTLAALALVTVAAAAVGAAAGTRRARVTGAAVALAAAVVFVVAARAAAVTWPVAGRWVLLASALALAAGALPRPQAAARRQALPRPEPAPTPQAGPAPEAAPNAPAALRYRVALSVLAHAGAFIAVVVTGGGARDTALLFALWGAALGLRAAWPAKPARARTGWVAAAGACEVVAWWLLLDASGVEVVEAYTVPAAAVALAAGWLALRRRPDLRSWVAYGPGLAVGLLPSLALVLDPDAAPPRRLVLGAAAVAVTVAGAVRRRQAPVLIGGGVVLAVALHELILVWQRLAAWIPLALGGLLLVALAITYERQRRELRRLRAAVGRMT